MCVADSTDASRQHSRIYRGRHPGFRRLEPDAAGHRLPRGRQPLRLPADTRAAPGGRGEAGPLALLRPRAPTYGDLWQPGQAGHCTQVNGAGSFQVDRAGSSTQVDVAGSAQVDRAGSSV